jgi:hypothetical protein
MSSVSPSDRLARGLVNFNGWGVFDDFSDFSGFGSMLTAFFADIPDEPVGHCRTSSDFGCWFMYLPPHVRRTRFVHFPAFHG